MLNDDTLNDDTEVHVMKGTARVASLFAGTALAFGLLAGVAPAALAGGDHGDGRDHKSSEARAQRSDVDTTDWPQGKSLSDPDGGLWDKPGYGGGENDDRDGNNGCGNDTDRSDDNNGWCGRDKDGGAEVQADTDDADDVCAVGDDDAGTAGGGAAGNHGAEVKSVATTRGDDNHGTAVSAVAKANDKANDTADADDESDDKSKCDDTDTTVSAAGLTGVTKVEGKVESTPAATAALVATSVLGATEVAPADTNPASGTQVMGITETAPSTLARTGAGVGILALLGGLCLGGGRLTALLRRRLGS